MVRSGYLDDANVYFEITEDQTDTTEDQDMDVINEQGTEYKIAQHGTNSSPESTEIHVEIQDAESPLQRNEKMSERSVQVEEINHEPSDEETFEDNLTDALFHLGAATQQLANALHSVSRVLMNRKQSRAKRARYH